MIQETTTRIRNYRGYHRCVRVWRQDQRRYIFWVIGYAYDKEIKNLEYAKILLRYLHGTH